MLCTKVHQLLQNTGEVMRIRYSDIFPSLFLQDEKETEHVLVLRVQASLWGSPGVNSVCTHLLFF